MLTTTSQKQKASSNTTRVTFDHYVAFLESCILSKCSPESCENRCRNESEENEKIVKWRIYFTSNKPGDIRTMSRKRKGKSKQRKTNNRQQASKVIWLLFDTTNLSLLSRGPTYWSIRLSKKAPSIANIEAGTRKWFIFTSRFLWGRDRASTFRNRPMRNAVEIPRAAYRATTQAKYGASSMSDSLICSHCPIARDGCFYHPTGKSNCTQTTHL